MNALNGKPCLLWYKNYVKPEKDGCREIDLNLNGLGLWFGVAGSFRDIYPRFLYNTNK